MPVKRGIPQYPFYCHPPPIKAVHRNAQGAVWGIPYSILIYGDPKVYGRVTEPLFEAPLLLFQNQPS